MNSRFYFIQTVIFFLILALFVIGAAKPSILVPVQADGKIAKHPAVSNPKPEPLRSMVSSKNILGLDRTTPFGLAKGKGGSPLALSIESDTVRVLALKIEFQTENPDDPTTTGNGNIDLRTYEQFYQQEGNYFDPAPHNTSYFAAHMQALARYWYFVSDRQLRLLWDVYPQAESVAIKLPNPMSYYGSKGIQDSIVIGLDRFFSESIRLADSLYPQIDFSRYQSVLLFHAGSDQQNNFAFINDTPNDLWTGFIMLEHAVEVDSGRNSVREGLIMPETASQDNRITCLNAVLAHEFGHQLGLVDIYNTSNFLTQVGNFSLMDNNGMSIALDFGAGGSYVSGTMPVYPDAWSRAYLGFSGVSEIIDSQDVKIRAAEQNYHNSELVKVPISENEYFLLENRQIDADFSYLNYPTAIPNALLADPVTGVILGPGYAYISGIDTVKVPTGEYDRLLPGSGILVWHVDEEVAYMDYTGSGANNFLMNTLQWDANRRFLSLEEADGIIDFGGNYVSSNYYGLGSDYFKEGNNTTLTPYSNPNSNSTLGLNSHITITGIGESDTIMTCATISNDWHRTGFPIMSLPDLGNNCGPIAADINLTGRQDIITGGGRFLAAIKADGSSLIENNYGLLLPRYDGDSLIYRWPLFAQLDARLAGNIVAGNFYGGDSLEIACMDTAFKIYFFNGTDRAPVDSLADLLAAKTLPEYRAVGTLAAYDIDGDNYDEVVAGLNDGAASRFLIMKVVEPDSIAITASDSLGAESRQFVLADTFVYALLEDANNNILYVGARNGSEISQSSRVSLPRGNLGGLAAGDINRDSIVDAIVTVGDYLCLYNGASGAVRAFAFENPGKPALGDINGDGYPEIVFAGGSDLMKIYAINSVGVLLSNYPVKLNYRVGSSGKQNEPILADLDNDGNADIVASLPEGGLTCYNYNGEKLSGFPLATSAKAITPALAFDIDGDNYMELAAVDSDGFINGWNLGIDYQSIDLPWPMADGGYKGNAYLARSFNKPISVVSGFLEEKAVYNYPNPASDRTAFRFYVDQAAQISVKIFDLYGEKIDELSGSTSGGIDDEISWDCNRFASGVYFARFEAKSANRTKHVMIKVALIK